MSVEMDVPEYTSPIRKLVRVFKKGRDKWKKKCQAAKRENKLLNNQTRAVELSREHWKKMAREQAAKIAALEQELEKKALRPLN
jgi:hypothetical protein